MDSGGAPGLFPVQQQNDERTPKALGRPQNVFEEFQGYPGHLGGACQNLLERHNMTCIFPCNCIMQSIIQLT